MLDAPPTPPIGNDLLHGADAIAAELGISKRQAFHWLEQKRIPAGKVGGRYIASRSTLRDHFARLTGGGDA